MLGVRTTLFSICAINEKSSVICLVHEHPALELSPDDVGARLSLTGSYVAIHTAQFSNEPLVWKFLQTAIKEGLKVTTSFIALTPSERPERPSIVANQTFNHMGKKLPIVDAGFESQLYRIEGALLLFKPTQTLSPTSLPISSLQNIVLRPLHIEGHGNSVMKQGTIYHEMIQDRLVEPPVEPDTLKLEGYSIDKTPRKSTKGNLLERMMVREPLFSISDGDHDLSSLRQFFAEKEDTQKGIDATIRLLSERAVTYEQEVHIVSPVLAMQGKIDLLGWNSDRTRCSVIELKSRSGQRQKREKHFIQASFYFYHIIRSCPNREKVFFGCDVVGIIPESSNAPFKPFGDEHFVPYASLVGAKAYQPFHHFLRELLNKRALLILIQAITAHLFSRSHNQGMTKNVFVDLIMMNDSELELQRTSLTGMASFLDYPLRSESLLAAQRISRQCFMMAERRLNWLDFGTDCLCQLELQTTVHYDEGYISIMRISEGATGPTDTEKSFQMRLIGVKNRLRHVLASELYCRVLDPDVAPVSDFPLIVIRTSYDPSTIYVPTDTSIRLVWELYNSSLGSDKTLNACIHILTTSRDKLLDIGTLDKTILTYETSWTQLPRDGLRSKVLKETLGRGDATLLLIDEEALSKVDSYIIEYVSEHGLIAINDYPVTNNLFRNFTEAEIANVTTLEDFTELCDDFMLRLNRFLFKPTVVLLTPQTLILYPLLAIPYNLIHLIGVRENPTPQLFLALEYLPPGALVTYTRF
ncbi:hypothetical protein GMRT_13691 [Giardia muris]|uniref:Uncharacterized protein n=1 Tax=Giardia muris TaxID=5742 RepID=A0A4Z1SY64_GIAMU|nr:hypothetical protein GMRT_13691 [Giardia muris]|eukprot:TNJ30692.1 hypothetical protein GMRT_13691 [Giardia muris]